ncbi:MAG: glycogen phosphorylase [Actinomycetota bacterium]|nr:glycogen phosphorylase [Actinomycetota bacterium]
MKAIRQFTVRTVLPEPLAALGELVLNLRWSWHPETLDLFQSIDPVRWRAVGGDPARLLGEVPPARLAELAADENFLHRLEAAAAGLHEYLSQDRWFQTHATQDGNGGKDGGPPHAIAYLSPEYGITSVLPQYSGGLGILAGDHLKTASDLGVPVIGVGLMYRRGYFNQSLSREGWQQERYPPVDPHGLPLTLLTEANGAPVNVRLRLPGRELQSQVWLCQVGRIPLLLLDSDVEGNAPAERDVTDRLYGGGSDHRFRQELLLGVGGVRAVRAFCRLTGHAQPEVYHMNEGHAGFLALERIRELVADDSLTFDEALEVVRASTLFTTHTPVPAGIDRFPKSLVEQHFGAPDALGLPIDRVLALGAESFHGGDPAVFNMALMGLRVAQRANGVSKLHGEVSRRMFAGLWPDFDPADVPITSITNGVHAPTWVSREIRQLVERDLGVDLQADGAGWSDAERLDDRQLWDVRRTLRSRLVDEARVRLRESWLQRGAMESELGWIADALDPDILTIGFARRVPSYKRLTLMLNDRERFTSLLLDPKRPVQFIIAGKAHPADDGGKRMIQEIVRFADSAEVRHRIVFLPDYDMAMAQALCVGADVWLNNPLRPLEACGTSGMKAALNGGLNLSIRDGWWDEWFDGNNGWAIPSANDLPDERRDELEAAAFYDIVETQMAPRFYDHDGNGLPTRWLEMVRHTLASLGPKVVATRMLRDYVTDLYAPAAQSFRQVRAGDFAGARHLAAWKKRVSTAWRGVRVEHVEARGVSDALEYGTVVSLRAVVALGELAADDVDVQAAYGRVNEHDEIVDPTYASLRLSDKRDDGSWVYEGEMKLDRTGPFGYSVRVLPSDPLLASPAELGLVALPTVGEGMVTGDLR